MNMVIFCRDLVMQETGFSEQNKREGAYGCFTPAQLYDRITKLLIYLK